MFVPAAFLLFTRLSYHYLLLLYLLGANCIRYIGDVSQHLASVQASWK
jgi:hypothetical protein